MTSTRKMSCSRSLLALSFLTGFFSATANATQYVADLVPQEWLEINRSVEVRQKLYSTNLYGAEAEVQVMFKQNGSPVTFSPNQLAVNADSFSCRLPDANDDLGSLDSNYAKVCNFTPKLLLTNGDGNNESWREYWMRIKLTNASGRSVALRHLQPVSPHCDVSGNVDAYNRLNSCQTVVSDLTFNNNLIHKPRVSYGGDQWAPLALKNNTYRVTLDVRKGKVELINGIKLKVSASIPAEPNDELLDGAEFLTECALEKGLVMPVGVYTCEFTAADDGFVHIPLQRVGINERRVITTLQNITQP